MRDYSSLHHLEARGLRLRAVVVAARVHPLAAPMLRRVRVERGHKFVIPRTRRCRRLLPLPSL